MRRVVLLLMSGMLMGGLLGCEHVPAQGPCVESEWRTELVISGGFAGIHREMSLDASGSLTTREQHSGNERSRVVGCETVQEVTALYEAAGAPPAAPGGFAPRCADCFTYTLKWYDGAKTLNYTVDSVGLEKSPYRPLLERLQALMDEPLIEEP